MRQGQRRGGTEAAAPGAPRQLWVLQDGQPTALQVTTGITDGRNTEVVGEQVKEGLAVITEQRAALCDAAGQAFYNTSKFTLRDLKSRGSQQQLLADFEDYLNGFSPNVQDILENFKFRNQLPTLSKADALGTLIAKFLDPDIDLSPAGIDNHAMGNLLIVTLWELLGDPVAGLQWAGALLGARGRVLPMASVPLTIQGDVLTEVQDSLRVTTVFSGSSDW